MALGKPLYNNIFMAIYKSSSFVHKIFKTHEYVTLIKLQHSKVNNEDSEN